MAIVTKWSPQKFIRDFENNLNRNLDEAAEHLQSDIQDTFPGRGRKPSLAGEIPTVQLGGLKRSIRREKSAKGFARKVGSDIKGYPMYLEYGTRLMKKRPYLRPAIERNRMTLKTIIERPMK